MNYTIIKKLSPPDEMTQRFHLPLADQKQILQHRREIRNILSGKDERLIMIVGPCSAWPSDAVVEYAKKLSVLNDRVKQKLKLIIRAYMQKPRTTVGWLGPAIQPDPFSAPDIDLGTAYVRELMLKITQFGLPIASEVLFTHHYMSFQDLLSWACIGARSSEDQEHRILASSFPCPIGIKNPTHGALDIGINSVLAAQHSHVAALNGYQVETHGNPYAHVVLRGANRETNFSVPHLETVKMQMELNKIKNPAILIDASHDNSFVSGVKDYRQQPKVILEVLAEMENRPDLKKFVKGFMIESFLQEGQQKISLQDPNGWDRDGLSITDPCLSWEQTESLLLKIAEQHLSENRSYQYKEYAL